MEGNRKVAIKLINDLIHSGNEDYSISEIVDALRLADDLYYNDQESYCSDSEYDALRIYGERLEPHNVYFTGVGSDVRGGKIKLPYEMGSLDQVQIGEVLDWIKRWKLHDQDVVLTDKLDGTSAMIIYDFNGDLQIAYSRGNGTEGADITRHIKRFASVPSQIEGPGVIRGEVILSKMAFENLRDSIDSRSGRVYKNARNMVAGLMNSKKIDPIAYDVLDFVAYDARGDGFDSKDDQLSWLDEEGFLTPHWASFPASKMTDQFLADFLEKRRKVTNYEIDGLVIDVDSGVKRKEMVPTRDTLNPAYSVKYKVADASNVAIATVTDVVYAASKHGYLKPRVQIEPVELVGVTVTFATGFNAKFIMDNNIGPGAQIQITRSGDVIPFIQKVVKPATRWQEPNESWQWNETNVDAVLDGFHDNEDVIVSQLVDFFAAIDAPRLREGSIRKLYAANYNTPERIIRMREARLVEVLGTNGKKVREGLDAALTNIPAWKLMGATNFFGRGIGRRKIKKLVDALGYEKLFTGRIADFKDVPSFDDKSAEKVYNGMLDYLDWAGPLEEDGYITIDYTVATASGGSMTDQKVVFTGFRDKDLQEQVENAGGTMQSTISSKTTIVVTKDPNGTSSKLKKARDLGTKIVSVDDFKGML